MKNPKYVSDGNGNYLVQAEEDNRWGFSLFSDDQSWPGGFGSGWRTWHIVPKAKVPKRIRKTLDFLFDL